MAPKGGGGDTVARKAPWTPWPMAPQRGGGEYGREEARRGPHAPPPNPRGSFWLVLLVDLLIFWNRFACNLITVFVMFFHANNLTRPPIFFEVPSLEELRDPDSSPRREEVGRRTLRDYGGFLLSFFYRERFRLFTQQFPVFVDDLQKLSLTSL